MSALFRCVVPAATARRQKKEKKKEYYLYFCDKDYFTWLPLRLPMVLLVAPVMMVIDEEAGGSVGGDGRSGGLYPVGLYKNRFHAGFADVTRPL